MKILIIHQVPYRKINYHVGLDHQRHDVTYVGYPMMLAELPEGLRCRCLALKRDEDLVTGILARTSPADGFEKVLALSEFGILAACHVRRHLGLDGPSLDQVERIRDKVRMKEALVDSGVRYPRFVAATPDGGPLPWSGKTVLKPRQGASSEGVSIHASTTEALAAYQAVENHLDFQLEEYIEGDLFHADGLVVDGKTVDLVVSKYINKPVDFLNGEPIGSYQLPRSERHRTFAIHVITELGIDAGCIHLEFFETLQRDLVFLEIANRMGGGGIVHSHLRHTGVHLPSHDIAVRLGMTRPDLLPGSGRYHGWVIFPGHHLPPGAGHSITMPEHIRQHPCVDNVYTLDPAQPLPDHVTYQEWEVPVFIEASHTNAQVLGEYLRECAQSISVQEDKAHAALSH